MAIDRGWLHDEVQIVLTEQSLTRRCKSYSVKTSVFQQPAAFSLRCGEPATAAEIIKRHLPGDPFELRLLRAGDAPGSYDLDVPLQTGRLDAVDIPESEETVVEFRGRDNMAALFDSFFMQDDSVTEATYYDLVAKQLKAVGFEPDDEWLFTGDTGRKKAVTNAGGGMRRKPKIRVGLTTVEHLDYAYQWTPNAHGADMQVVRISAPSSPTTGPYDAKGIEV